MTAFAGTSSTCWQQYGRACEADRAQSRLDRILRPCQEPEVIFAKRPMLNFIQLVQHPRKPSAFRNSIKIATRNFLYCILSFMKPLWHMFGTLSCVRDPEEYGAGVQSLKRTVRQKSNLRLLYLCFMVIFWGL